MVHAVTPALQAIDLCLGILLAALRLGSMRKKGGTTD